MTNPDITKKALFIKEMYYNVIKPKIVKMACEDSLPSDLTQLGFESFEDNILEYLKEREFDIIVEAAANFLTTDAYSLSIEDQVMALINSDLEGSDLIDDVEGVYPAEMYEYKFTIKQFLNEINLDETKYK